MNSRLSTIIGLGLAAMVLAACETAPITPPPLTPPPPPPPPPTPAEEFAWSTVRGPNALIVTMAYHPSPAQAWSCQGQTQALMPETSYSRSRIVTLYGSAERAMARTTEVRQRSAANPGADYGQYVKTATCDAADTFAFSNLPDGAYFLIAQVREVRPPGSGGDMVVMQRVQVSGGQATRIVVPAGARVAPPPPPPPPPPPRRRTQ